MLLVLSSQRNIWHIEKRIRDDSQSALGIILPPTSAPRRAHPPAAAPEPAAPHRVPPRSSLWVLMADQQATLAELIIKNAEAKKVVKKQLEDGEINEKLAKSLKRALEREIDVERKRALKGRVATGEAVASADHPSASAIDWPDFKYEAEYRQWYPSFARATEAVREAVKASSLNFITPPAGKGNSSTQAKHAVEGGIYIYIGYTKESDKFGVKVVGDKENAIILKQTTAQELAEV